MLVEGSVHGLWGLVPEEQGHIFKNCIALMTEPAPFQKHAVHALVLSGDLLPQRASISMIVRMKKNGATL